ncbi:MAG: hypothetical protein MUD14_18975 [Hydrococcus sp. Prado102]|nr:hypothetical protein [Hydrococcus sp. Prado102]
MDYCRGAWRAPSQLSGRAHGVRPINYRERTGHLKGGITSARSHDPWRAPNQLSLGENVRSPLLFGGLVPKKHLLAMDA